MVVMQPNSHRPGFRRWIAGAVVLSLVLVGLVTASPGQVARAQAAPRPNIVLIVTDDQRADALVHMPHVRRLLARRGMRLTQAVVSNPICCPSRATILTGRYSHSTGVYTNFGGTGGWHTFNESGAEASTIATALDGAGYRTAMIGKYMNGYAKAGPYVPPGWDRWFALAHNNGRYYDYRVYAGAGGYIRYGSRPSDYSTDVIARRAAAFIGRTKPGLPLFLMVTPYAPHLPTTPAPRHEGDLSHASVRFGPAVNEANVSDKPAYIRRLGLHPLSELRGRTIRQWESLLAVDDLVRRLVTRLRETGRLRNTLIMFTSDNGFSNREHRWGGKRAPYLESIRVPFVVRFDGRVPAGTRSGALAANVDIAPTIADFAQVPFPGADGVSLSSLVTRQSRAARSPVLLEFVQQDTAVPTYCGVRTRRFVFVRYATREEELYDLADDPWQLRNVARKRPAKTRELRNLTMSLCQPRPPGFAW
jgi:N-acetylglucosamine-6-sulfatase